MTEHDRLWTTCCRRLREEVSEAQWKTWFLELEPVRVDGDELVLSAPSSPVRDGLERQHLALLERAASETAGRVLKVRITVRPAPSPPDLEASLGDVDDDAEPDWAGADAEWHADADDSVGEHLRGTTAPPGAQPSTAPWADAPSLSPRYTFDAFVIGDSNRFAHAAAQRVAETPAASYNPLFIYGNSGLGKTHLLHAIGHYVIENFPSKRVRYVSTETLLNEFIDAIRNKSQMLFKRRYRECDLLLVDDIQFMAGKDQLQVEFFHTFNWLYEGSKQIVLSSDRHPRSIKSLEDRLSSRFEWGLTTDVQPPALETRLAILRKKAETESTPIPGEVLGLIAEHVRDNIRKLEGALVRVSAFASLYGQAPTLEVAERLLSDIIMADRPRKITGEVIICAVADYYHFSVEDLIGPSRRRPLVDARQMAMYLCRDLTDNSFPAIAREFGDRDHTTVLHAVNQIERKMKEDRAVYDQVRDLNQMIKEGRS